jgi:hypothetical protein
MLEGTKIKNKNNLNYKIHRIFVFAILDEFAQLYVYTHIGDLFN